VVVVAAMNWVESGSGFKANSPDELKLALSRIGTLNRSGRFVWRGAAPVDKATGIISGKGVLGGTNVGFYTHIRYALSAFTGGAISLNLL